MQLLLGIPRWRTLFVAFLTGLPRAIAGIATRSAPDVKAAIADVLLAAPRIVGILRESLRTRPKPKETLAPLTDSTARITTADTQGGSTP